MTTLVNASALHPRGTHHAGACLEHADLHPAAEASQRRHRQQAEGPAAPPLPAGGQGASFRPARFFTDGFGGSVRGGPLRDPSFPQDSAAIFRQGAVGAYAQVGTNWTTEGGHDHLQHGGGGGHHRRLDLTHVRLTGADAPLVVA